MYRNAAHAEAYQVAATRNLIIDTRDARTLIADPHPGLRACGCVRNKAALRLARLAEIERALCAVIVYVAPVLNFDEVSGSITPEVLAISPYLRRKLLEGLERKAASAVCARRRPTA
jgi:hypothetical protein